jgi:adenylate cyclase
MRLCLSFTQTGSAYIEGGVMPSAEAFHQMTPGTQNAMLVCRFRKDNSVFINHSYLIRGVAGTIIWKLLTDYLYSGRTVFNNRELRLDPSLNLPEIGDNLEVRLSLLKRRLETYGPNLRLVKVGRGHFKLEVLLPVQLQEL